MRFNFIDSNGKTVRYDDDTKLVYGQGLGNFLGAVRITSEGIDGDANKLLRCNYELLNLPTKRICRDVIKYRDIERERQVTAFRTVTENRTELKCD